jgi:hypothetical protein
MSKLQEIVEGWRNVVFPNEHAEKVANARAAICARCEYIKAGKCGKCGCNLAAKTRSMKSKCPMDKW